MVAAAKSKRAGESQRTEMAQKPSTHRNAALAALAAKGQYRDLADETEGNARLGVPALTGRFYDLGGGVEAVLLAPWCQVDGRTVFRGDVVRVSDAWLDGRDGFARLK